MRGSIRRKANLEIICLLSSFFCCYIYLYLRPTKTRIVLESWPYKPSLGLGYLLSSETAFCFVHRKREGYACFFIEQQDMT